MDGPNNEGAEITPDELYNSVVERISLFKWVKIIDGPPPPYLTLSSYSFGATDPPNLINKEERHHINHDTVRYYFQPRGDNTVTEYNNIALNFFINSIMKKLKEMIPSDPYYCFWIQKNSFV